MRVRLTHRVLVHLDGGSMATGVPGTAWYSRDPAAQDAADRLVATLAATRTRKDGSMTIEADDRQLDVLRGYIGGMEMGGRDNAWDPDGRADYNAARALLNRIGRREW